MEPGQHTVRISVQARGFWCEGDIIVPRPGGYKGRVHDVLNSSEEFIALTDVTLSRDGEGAGDQAVSYDVLLLRKGEIQFIVPLD
jgi:hypothetical protein